MILFVSPLSPATSVMDSTHLQLGHSYLNVAPWKQRLYRPASMLNRCGMLDWLSRMSTRASSGLAATARATSITAFHSLPHILLLNVTSQPLRSDLARRAWSDAWKANRSDPPFDQRHIQQRCLLSGRLIEPAIGGREKLELDARIARGIGLRTGRDILYCIPTHFLAINA